MLRELHRTRIATRRTFSESTRHRHLLSSPIGPPTVHRRSKEGTAMSCAPSQCSPHDDLSYHRPSHSSFSDTPECSLETTTATYRLLRKASPREWMVNGRAGYRPIGAVPLRTRILGLSYPSRAPGAFCMCPVMSLPCFPSTSPGDSPFSCSASSLCYMDHLWIVVDVLEGGSLHDVDCDGKVVEKGNPSEGLFEALRRAAKARWRSGVGEEAVCTVRRDR
ncbi:hypothetical protein DFP72DRAFT_477785 [Ephemerocybe angulata]|uniref:Uncharacterized protein n=1 Tax=Ephemerocybe angulata TaxID=980116 RepID=A0A8H6IG30_9AGAR|nr:hypothetical protein DFP72DRAFT_477785 [Tulosesus angulatus]